MELYINVPEQVKNVLKEFHNVGFEAYIVGGCVRDSIIGKEPKDWDVCTNATPNEVDELFKNKMEVIPTGIEFGTMTVLSDDMPIEVTTYRIDGEYRASRFPEVKFTTSLIQDLSRRDFTMNAIAYDYREEKCIDPFNGVEAINNKLITTVGKASDRFEEDALRMLRAVRFSAQLDFNIDKNNTYAFYATREKLKDISAERIRAELYKILMTNPLKLMTFEAEIILEQIIPKLEHLREFTQNNPYHSYDVFEHSIRATAIIEPEIHLRLAALLHDLGKAKTLTVDENGIDHFYGHEIESKQEACRVMADLKIDNATRQKVKTLIEFHSRRVPVKKKSVKKMLNLLGEELFFDWCKLRWADICAQNLTKLKPRAEKIIAIEQMAREILAEKEPFDRKALAINGKDLIAIGFEPGIQLGETLDYLLDIVMDNQEYNTREILLEKAKEKLAID